MWINSLFCSHEWSPVSRYDFNSLLDTISIEKCCKCQKEVGIHIYRTNVFGPPVYRKEMPVNQANAEVKRIQELYAIEATRDWNLMTGEEVC